MPQGQTHVAALRYRFTTHSGEVFELVHGDLPSYNGADSVSVNKSIRLDIGDANNHSDSFDGPSSPQRASRSLTSHPSTRRNQSCSSTLALIEVVSPVEMAVRHPTIEVSMSLLPSLLARGRSLSLRQLKKTEPDEVPEMAYTGYGELVDAQSLLNSLMPDDLTITQLLRVIKKAYHHDFRKRMDNIIVPRMDGKSSIVVEDGSLIWSDRLSSWEFRPRSLKSVTHFSPDEISPVAVFRGPPRVLEIGCSDGSWCFKVKNQQPDWIIEGVDDTDHWSCVRKDIPIKDFITPETRDPDDHFSIVHSSQIYPEFTVRDINRLVAHENPIPQNLYGLIRAKDIFARVESYKSFLEDVRTILQPDGVVEFVEVDPFPRHMASAGCSPRRVEDHTSSPQSDWTDNIRDRFKDRAGDPVAETVPGWVDRVEQRLKTGLRPVDGVAATNLKSWLEGVGFWDVKQLILRLPVGGCSTSGKLLRDFLLYQIELENEIPKLRAELPEVELDELEDEKYYLNLHIVTGRKPCTSRPGDILLNGTRQEMSEKKYNAMARFNDEKSQQWKRFDLDSQLSTMMENLARGHGQKISLSGPQSMTMPEGASEATCSSSKTVKKERNLVVEKTTRLAVKQEVPSSGANAERRRKEEGVGDGE